MPAKAVQKKAKKRTLPPAVKEWIRDVKAYREEQARRGKDITYKEAMTKLSAERKKGTKYVQRTTQARGARQIKKGEERYKANFRPRLNSVHSLQDFSGEDEWYISSENRQDQRKKEIQELLLMRKQKPLDLSDGYIPSYILENRGFKPKQIQRYIQSRTR